MAKIYLVPEMSGYRGDLPGLLQFSWTAAQGASTSSFCEAIDRIARDGKDIAWLGKKLKFDRDPDHVLAG